MDTQTPNTPATPETSTPAPQQTVTLTEREKAFAATNHPALAPDSFTLGERTFPVLFLKYKDQIRFIAELQPLLRMFGVDSLSPEGLEDIVDKFSMSGMMQYCMEGLPAMVTLICQNSDPSITVDYVLAAAQSPFQLCGIIMQQIAVNNMLNDIAAFFRSLRPMKMMLMGSRRPSTPKATPSS